MKIESNFENTRELERVRKGGKGAFAIEFVAIEGVVMLNIVRNAGKDIFELSIPLNPYKMPSLIEQAIWARSKAMYEQSFEKNHDL